MASVNHDYQPGFAGRIPSKGTLDCATNIRIPGGTIVTVDSDGRADVPTNTQNAAGIALATFDNRTTAPEGGAAGAITVEVLYGVFEVDYTGTAPDAGDVVYVSDNHTVTTNSAGGTLGIAGYCVAQHTTGKCDVWFGPHVVGQIAINATVVSDLDALELEVGDYTGGGGAEADVASGLVQAETDITNLQALNTVQIASKAFGFAEVAALGAVASGSIDFDAALPAGAVVIGGGINVTAVFDNVADGASVVADLGIASGDTDAFCDGMPLDAIAKVGAVSGAGIGTLVGAITPSVLVDPDVDCDTITKGAAVAYVLYVEAF